MVGSTWRRSYKIGIAALLLTPFVAACGSSSTAPSSAHAVATGKPIKIPWMMWGNNSTATIFNKALAIAYPSLAKEYQFTAQIPGSSDTEVDAKYLLELSSHSHVPGAIAVMHRDLAYLAPTHSLTNLTQDFKPYEKDLMKSELSLVTVHGQIYAFPYQLHLKLWFYRKDMFKNAGINPSQVTDTAQFIQAGKQLQKKYPSSYIWNLGSPIDYIDIGEILSGNGGEFTNSKGQFVINTNPGVRKAFLALKTLWNSGVVDDAVTDLTPAWSKGFADGTLASWIGVNWLQQFLPSYAPNESGEWGVTQWPRIGGAVGGSNGGGEIFLVPKNAPHRRAVIMLLTDLLLTKKGNLALFKVAGNLPLVKSALYDPVTEKPVPYFGSAFPLAERQALKTFKVHRYDPNYPKELAIVNDYLQSYLEGKMTLNDALNGAQKACQSQIGGA